MSVVEVEFFEVHRVARYTVICITDIGAIFRVVVPRRLRSIVECALYNGGCYIGVDSLSNIRCVLDSSCRIIFLDCGRKITYKKNLITPLTSRIIF